MNTVDFPSKTFCRLPFSHIYADEIGQLYPCCMAVTPSSLFTNPEGIPLNISDPKIHEQLKDSPQLNAIKKDLIEGREPLCCQSCFKFERAGITSSRQAMNTQFSNVDFFDLIETPELLSIDLRLGNNCNLKCQMCHPRNSQLLEKEFKKFYSFELNTKEKNLLNWSKDINVFFNLLNKLKQNAHIHFAGGEPLLSKEGFDFIQTLVDRSMAPEITLSYNTNLSFYPEKYVALWKQFKKVEILVSIDGTEELNEYIRYPLKWSRFDENISQLYKVCRDFPQIQMHFHTVAQMYNIFSLNKVATYTQNFSAINPSHRFDFITGFNHPFSLLNLPWELKEKSKQKIISFINSEEFKKFHGYYELKGNLELVLKELDRNPESSFKRSIYYTVLFDQSRKHDFFKIQPEFSHYSPDKKTLFFYKIKKEITNTWWIIAPKELRVSLGRFIFKYFKKIY